MRLIYEGSNLWGVERNGVKVITGESYQVASNICEPNCKKDEAAEVRKSIESGFISDEAWSQ